jgi:RNA polymerase sigma factor (sigma-70 family)
MPTICVPPVESGLRRITPRVHNPASRILERLSPADRELLRKRLSEPAECIFHPSFRRVTMPAAPAALEPRTSPVAWEDAVDPVEEEENATPATAVLTAAEERALFLRFNYCRYRVLRILKKYAGRRLSGGAMRDLLRWERLALQTRGDILRANTALVLAMARRSRNSGVELGELISEGNLALLRCVDKFDAARGFKFSTYACRAILASFSRAAAKAARLRTQFPTPYDPALERSDFLETRRERTERECVDELKRILFENGAALTLVERRVLNARFSLDQRSMKPGVRRRTLDQVGDLLGVSKERVRQIQNQAMIKLRAALENRLLAAS